MKAVSFSCVLIWDTFFCVEIMAEVEVAEVGEVAEVEVAEVEAEEVGVVAPYLLLQPRRPFQSQRLFQSLSHNQFLLLFPPRLYRY